MKEKVLFNLMFLMILLFSIVLSSQVYAVLNNLTKGLATGLGIK